GQRHEDPGGAEAALHAVVAHELLLQRVEGLGTGGQALDGVDAGAVGLDGQEKAAAHRLAVDEHGARAAHALLAAHVGAGEAEPVAEEVDQRGAGLHRGPAELAVHGEVDGPGLAHAARGAAASDAESARAVRTPARRLRYAALAWMSAGGSTAALARRPASAKADAD